jgi:hypothetical protein
MAPNCAVADVTKEGALIMCADQGIYQTRNGVARLIGLPLDRIRVQEGLMDELAFVARLDPYEFRKRNISNPRWLGVLRAATDAAKWTSRVAASNKSSAQVVTGRGIGLARRSKLTSLSEALRSVASDLPPPMAFAVLRRSFPVVSSFRLRVKLRRTTGALAQVVSRMVGAKQSDGVNQGIDDPCEWYRAIAIPGPQGHIHQHQRRRCQSGSAGMVRIAQAEGATELRGDAVFDSMQARELRSLDLGMLIGNLHRPPRRGLRDDELGDAHHRGPHDLDWRSLSRGLVDRSND